MTGTIKRIVRDRGFGFITDSSQHEYFFHRSEATGFDGLSEKQTVHFEAEETPKGLRAVNVAAALHE